MNRAMKPKQIEKADEVCCSAELTGCMPVLRFRLSFDLDLNVILGKFSSRGAQTLPLTIECGVERLSKRK